MHFCGLISLAQRYSLSCDQDLSIGRGGIQQTRSETKREQDKNDRFDATNGDPSP